MDEKERRMNSVRNSYDTRGGLNEPHDDPVERKERKTIDTRAEDWLERREIWKKRFGVDVQMVADVGNIFDSVSNQQTVPGHRHSLSLLSLTVALILNLSPSPSNIFREE